MKKEELLAELSLKINSGEISQEDLIKPLRFLSKAETFVVAGKDLKSKFSHFSITKMLYLLGAVVVIIGLIIFISQIWNDIGAVGRISTTLGLGLFITMLGSVLLKKIPASGLIHLGSIFHLIGGVLIPSGALVTLNELSVEIPTIGPVAITFGGISLFYLLLNLVHKNAILTFFTVANGTAFIYLFVETIATGRFYQHEDLYAYLTMVMGVSYFLLARAFQKGWNKSLTNVFYFLGSAGFFGATFSRVFDSSVWETLYFFLVFGGLFLSVYLKSRILLVVSTLFLVAHIIYITNEYFADSFGWPLSLVFLGFVFIGLGYFSITLNQKYFKKSE